MNQDNTSLDPPPPYSALIFDCDGTLADTMPLHYLAWKVALGAYNIEITEDLFYAWAGMTTDAMIRRFNNEFDYTLDVAETHAAKEGSYLELVRTVKEITPVADIARRHAGRIPIAVATSGTREIVEATLTATGLKSLFPVVVSAEDVQYGKPAPDLFLLAASRLGVAPADCIVYEDADAGMEAARLAGMRAVDVRLHLAMPEAALISR